MCQSWHWLAPSQAALQLQTPGHLGDWVLGHGRTYPAPGSCLGP